MDDDLVCRLLTEFPMLPIHREAAKEIDRLRALVEHYEKMVGHPNHVKSMATRHDPHKMKSATTQED